MKIYTKTGDKGKTSLLSGTRVNKYNIRIEAYGTVDELNSFLGLLNSKNQFSEIKEFILYIQKQLFNIGAILSMDKDPKEFNLKSVKNSDIEKFESEIDKMNSELTPLRHFILPGGNELVSLCHVCRTVSRRTERLVVELAENSKIDENIIKYLNRLSDYLFVLARYLAKKTKTEELKWIP